MSTQTDTISVLNDLIQTCKDGQEGFKTASESVTDSSLKFLFSEYSLQRAKFAAALQQEVARLGGNPETGGSVSASLHRGWINLKAAVTGKDESAIVSECERGEDAARDAYQDALKKGLTGDVRALVQEQAAEVQQAHNRIRSLEVKMSH